MAVGVAAQHLDAPAVDVVARLEQAVGALDPVDGGDEPVGLRDDPLDGRRRHALRDASTRRTARGCARPTRARACA